ncbi:MAG: glycosyltransferase [Anaerolineae bacterium]|nr:glycosyltransferase [Anaerolineae bacterium]
MDRFASRENGGKYLHIPHGAFDSPAILPESNAQDLLFFSTLAPFKGLELLLKAYAELKQEYPYLQLTIAGAEHFRFPDYLQEIRSKYEQLNSVRWLGVVKEEGLEEMFQRTQVVILPYQASTGSSSVLIRAATWGRSIIVSDLPEIQTFVNEMGLNVTFFENGNQQSLKRAIKAHLNSSELRREQAAKNLSAVKNNRLEVIRHAYLNAFNQALEIHYSPKRIEIPPLLSSELS